MTPLRPYPPVRQAPINQIRSDLDPSLVYDISAYGHVGYDSSVGPPDNDALRCRSSTPAPGQCTILQMMIRGWVH